MILTPFAAASTVTTFADGSSEVSIVLKDGVNSYNNTEGGFYLPNDETIASASMNLSIDPIKYNTNKGVTNIVSYSWDSNVNNGATQFTNSSEFEFGYSSAMGNSVSLSSESLLSDFEVNDFNMDNSTQYTNTQGIPIAWDYGNIKFKQIQNGPNTCFSGDMCWGTNIFDSDYTDDYDLVGLQNRHEYVISTPPTYLDNNLQDTYLRFASWHSMEAKFDSQGDVYYDDCAYLEVVSSISGQFSGEENTEILQINLQETTGIGSGSGLYAKSSFVTANKISGECDELNENQFGIAGTSVNFNNFGGWANIAANLAPYLGKYIKINFVLSRADAPGSVQSSNTPGWYIDDLQIGEGFVQESTMVINNIQTPQPYEEKSPNGFGLLFLDAFEPSDSSLSVTIEDSLTGIPITANDGKLLSNLRGPVIELWGVDVDIHPIINIKIKFDSGQTKTSTPIFYGYTLGTEYGLTFKDLDVVRDYNIVDAEWEYVHNKGESIMINTSDFIGESEYGGFSEPVYGLRISGIPTQCGASASISHGSLSQPSILSLDVINTLVTPLFEVDVKIDYSSSCTTRDIWIDLVFANHLEDIYLDFGNDSIYEWTFAEDGYGKLGFQNMFYGGELNGESQMQPSSKLTLDPITGSVIGGFFLLPKDSEIEYLNFQFSGNSIFNKNSTQQGFELNFVVGANTRSIEDIPNLVNFDLMETTGKAYSFKQKLEQMISGPNVPIIKTDSSGIDWVRIGFEIIQNDSNNGGSVNFEDLRILYTYKPSLSSESFTNYLREFVAVSNQAQEQSSTQTYIPLVTTSSTGGKITIANLSIVTESGYDSTLSWENDLDGFYATGELYEVITSHEVSASTGASLSECRIHFKTNTDSFYLVYNPVTGFGELDDDNDYITLHPSSSATNLAQSDGKEITWKFTINSNWNDRDEVLLLSETVADNNIIGMLSGLKLNPDVGNAVENDITYGDLVLKNAAGVIQDPANAYSSQIITLQGNVTFEDVMISPAPSSYFMVVEERGFETDGQTTNITWTEIANRSGFIGGQFIWDVNLGTFASGTEVYRFRLTGYEGGDIVCASGSSTIDSDCGTQFNLSIDILDPNLISMELYKRESTPGSVTNDDDWRQIYDDSWATPRLEQSFRFTISDLPLPPSYAVLHLWVEYDHDLNSNGLAEESEYVEVATTTDGASPNSTFSGSYNDMANSGLKGKVSVWIECYDLGGNSIEGGGPGLDNDYITYVSMGLEYPTISSLRIVDSNGVEMINDISSNPPEGVGIWNQTMFAGNEYNIVVEAKDGNGWKDVERVDIVLAPQETNYDSTITFYPRNQTAWTQSDLFVISLDSQGDSKASIRTDEGNVLLDPFEEDFIINIPISFDWGLPLVGQFTPSFQIKDLDNSPVFSEGSFRQTWRYENDIRLDFRSNLDGKMMISPNLEDLDIPISQNLYHEIGQQEFIGSVTGGDTVLFSGQYSFTSGMLEEVFIKPEVELTMELTRKEVFRDAQKDYDPVDEEITLHTFSGGSFEIPIKMPSYQNEFEYTFRLINLPVGAEDLTSSYCFGSNINGCAKFVIKVDDEAPKLVFGSWSATRGENTVSGLDDQLYTSMPTSTYHCVDVTSQIEERGSLSEEDTKLNWAFYNGNPENGNIWDVYQNNYGTSPLSTSLNLSGGSLGYVRASADCVDLWPVGIGQFEVTESDLNVPGLSVNLVMWIETQDGAGSPIIGAGIYNDDGTASGIEGNDADGSDSSSYLLEFEGTDFNVRNIRTIPDSPEVGDKVILEVELVNSGIPGVADLEIRSVINNGVPAFEGYIVSEVIGENEARWVSIELAEFTDATTGMYYIVYDNETGDVLFNGKDQAKTFNVKASSSGDSGFSTGLIVIILIAVIAILVVAVVVISRRNNDVEFDDLYDDEDDKSYASIPPTQSYSAPAAQVSPEMAEAMEKFTFWTQEEIQGYFDQGWSIQQLEEWLESQ